MTTDTKTKPEANTHITSRDLNCNESATCQVLTYDGHRAAQRPRVVIFDDIEYQVRECESLFISTGEAASAPVRRGFVVRCEGGRQFRLTLTEGVGWLIESQPGLFVTP
ncbi:MAG: hypothetical protein JXX14_15425 [Deltaproteobacteria bacterium]|nr:hypothetical protein [Deltaproteobacteria bacterium]